jgi:hypothetical protein
LRGKSSSRNIQRSAPEIKTRLRGGAFPVSPSSGTPSQALCTVSRWANGSRTDLTAEHGRWRNPKMPCCTVRYCIKQSCRRLKPKANTARARATDWSRLFDPTPESRSPRRLAGLGNAGRIGGHEILQDCGGNSVLLDLCTSYCTVRILDSRAFVCCKWHM